MPDASYSINYNKKLKMLEFKHKFFSYNSISPLQSLFDNFEFSLAKIILDSYNLSVSRFYYCNLDYDACNAIFYSDSIQYNEKITDILFLYDKYRYFINHDSGFLTQEKFSYWQNAIKGVDKPAILKMLYQDNKISRAYLLKHANHPASLYELAKYSVFTTLPVEEATQTEKIDKLTLPSIIKDDLKLSFSKY